MATLLRLSLAQLRLHWPALRRLPFPVSFSIIPNPRIDVSIDHVDDQIDQNVEKTEDENRPLDHRVVPGEDGIHNEPPHPGPGENRLRQDSAPEKEPELESNDRYDGNESVRESMFDHDDRLSQPLRSRRGSVVLGKGFHHGGAGHASDEGDNKRSEGQSGE